MGSWKAKDVPHWKKYKFIIFKILDPEILRISLHLIFIREIIVNNQSREYLIEFLFKFTEALPFSFEKNLIQEGLLQMNDQINFSRMTIFNCLSSDF
jgi:hypothetical protein